MSFQNYQKLWKAYVDVFKSILLTNKTVGHAKDGSPAGRRLGQLCLEAGRLRTCLCFAHPTRYIGYNYRMGEVCCALDLLPTLLTLICRAAYSASCIFPLLMVDIGSCYGMGKVFVADWRFGLDVA